MDTYEINVRKNSGKYWLTRHQVGGTAERFFSLHITGPAMPQLPEEKLTRLEFLKWQVASMEQGYQIED